MDKTVKPGGRVLVIDDEAALLRSYDRILQKFFDVTLVGSGREAIEAIEQDPSFDVVLCDLQMPDLNGADVFETIGRIAPHLVERMVFCTGGATAPDLRQFITRIDNIKLEKPISVQTLRSVIAEVRDRFASP